MTTTTDHTQAPGRQSSGGFGTPLATVFLDGEFVSSDDARVSAHAQVLSYGVGTFEGIRAFWNAELEELFLLEPHAHYERMHRSSRILGLTLSLGVDELVEASAELLRRNEVRSDAYLRPILFLDGDELTVRTHGVGSRLQIAGTPIVGDYLQAGGVRCTVSSWRRAPDTVLPSRAKICGSYVGPALAKTEALDRGYDEALMLNRDGNVVEGTTSNLFVRRGGTWVTPPGSDDILEGVTRAQVATLLQERTGQPVVYRSIQRSELYDCEEALLCGTAALVAPIVNVDGRPVADGLPGETTSWLLVRLRSIARRRTDDRHEWTVPVYGEQAR